MLDILHLETQISWKTAARTLHCVLGLSHRIVRSVGKYNHAHPSALHQPTTSHECHSQRCKDINFQGTNSPNTCMGI